MTAPEQPAPENGDGGSVGRYLRAIVGTLLILFDLYLIWAEHVHQVPPKAFDTHDIIIHSILLVAGLMMVDRTAVFELVNAVKDRIPLIGGGK
jgi:hypothetical protein